MDTSIEYVSIEKQPKNIQEVFKKYFEGSLGLYEDNTGTIKHGYITKDRVMLLTEGQIRKFIEDKTDSSMSCRFEKYKSIFITDAYYIVLYDLITHKPKNTYESEKIKRIDAYLEVALEIIKEEIKEEL